MKKLVLVFVIAFVLLCGCGIKEGKVEKIDCATKDSLMQEANTVLIDVRTPGEYNEKHLEGAINIEYFVIVSGVEKQGNIDTDTNIILYCGKGSRSAKASEFLKKAGYKHIYDLGAITKCDNNEEN